MWLLLNGFTPGHLLLGLGVALFASRVMAALQPAKPRLRRWQLIPRLFFLVLADVVRSNVAVAEHRPAGQAAAADRRFRRHPAAAA